MTKKTLKDFSESEPMRDDECASLAEILEEIEDRLGKIEARLEKIEEAMQELKGRRQLSGTGINGMDAALKTLKERGFLREIADLSKTREREQIVSRLKGLGAVEIKGTKDTYIVHPRKFEEFVKTLEEIDISDPDAVGEKLGELKDLFYEMLRDGLVYFDVKEKKWKVIL